MTQSATDNLEAQEEINTVAFVSLGCPKNLVDSEKMFGLLAEDGIIPVSDESEADAIVVNTCGFLEASKQESVQVIQDAVARKEAGELKRVIVAGCLVQRHRAKMLDWCPGIDAMIGVFDRDRILDAVRPRKQTSGEFHQDLPVSAEKADGNLILPVYSSIAANAAKAKEVRALDPENNKGYFESDATRLRLTPRHYSYLRISEGCNQNCAFCTIPSIRGKMRSKPIDAILGEMDELFADGAFELNLIGQDTTSYGDDIGITTPNQSGLAKLLYTINDRARQEGSAWLRLMYAYPSCFNDDMIEAIAKCENIVKYIDMPLQHINDEILNNMRRKTSRQLITDLLDKLRDRIPGIAIRTTFISGYPGETDAQHQELLEFLEEYEFDAMGVFPYSPEPNTPAGTVYKKEVDQRIPDEIIQQRIDELMTLQQELVFERNQFQAEQGVEMDVLIDGGSTSEGGLTISPVHEGGKAGERSQSAFAGRCYFQAPDIDTLTYVISEKKLVPGELVRCKIIDSRDYDLIARPVEELENKVSLNIL